MDIIAPRLTDVDAAREYLESLRWPEGPFCPHCGSVNTTRLPPQARKVTKAHPGGSVRKGVIQCNDCREQYTVTVDTMFESSKIALNKRVLATFLLCSSKRATRRLGGSWGKETVFSLVERDDKVRSTLPRS